MRIVALLLITVSVSSTGWGEESVKANYAVWTRSSLHKVLKSDPIEPLEPASIQAARNEHEAFQIVLRPGRAGLEDVRVTAHDLASDKGRISGSNVSVYLPTYVYLPRLARHYPDALPPWQKPFDVSPGHTQPIWIDVYVPKRARPGEYKGRITIAPSNAETTEVPFSLRVYDFVLPDESKLVTAFGLYTDFVADQHGVPRDSEEARQLHKRYYELLLDRGISTYSIPVDIFSEEGASYITDPRVTSFVIQYTKNEQEQRRILDRVRSLNALDKAFFYFQDEPVNQEAYDNLRQGCDYLRKIDPAVNIVSPYFSNPDFTDDETIYHLLTGCINIWCFKTSFFDAKALDERRKAGDKIWDYVCCDPPRPYANFFVEYVPLEHRMLMWQNYLYDVSGLLYWCTTYWAQTEDPWANMATWHGLYGDGSLLYPGKKVGIDGPVSSIRLEVIRDGLEDYKYLWLLEQKIGRDAVKEYVR